MENAPGGRIPWDDLRYLFGQIIYGGHVVNDLDRLLVCTYLDHFLRDELLDEAELVPFARDERGPGASFRSPAPTTYDRYVEHIDAGLRVETPLAFGLHPNAEVGFRTEQSESVLRLLLELQPRDGGGDGTNGSAACDVEKTPRVLAATAVSEFLDAFGDVSWDVDEIATSALAVAGGDGTSGSGGSPFLNVLLLELKQMNGLLAGMKRSLLALRLGFEGRLTMSESMERLELALSLDRVPTEWTKLAWPSLRSLAAWKHNLTARVTQLSDWVSLGPSEPLRVTWLPGLSNPQSFLTAVRQMGASRSGVELDKLAIATEVTKKMTRDDVDAASRDGTYVSGLFLQGARWDAAAGVLDKSRAREMFVEMPIINLRPVLAEKMDAELRGTGTYACPVYKTEQRGPTYVFTAQLRTSSKSPPARWVLAGVSLLCDVT